MKNWWAPISLIIFAVNNFIFTQIVGDFRDTLCEYTNASFIDKWVLLQQENYRTNKEELKNIAECLLKKGEYEKAIHILRKAISMDSDKAEINNMRMMIALAFMKMEEYILAINELSIISEDGMERRLIVNKKVMIAGAYWQINDFENSREAIMSIIPDTCKFVSLKVDSLFKCIEKTTRKRREVLCYIMSSVLPGLCQAVNGDMKNAINAFLLNGFFMFLFVNAAVNSGLIPALFVVVPWFQRYYMGNLNHAISSQRERTEKLKMKIFFEIIGALKEAGVIP